MDLATFLIAGLGIVAYMVYLKNYSRQVKAKDDLVLDHIKPEKSKLFKGCIDGDGQACWDVDRYYDDNTFTGARV
jgi:hypothetical protein